MIPDPQNPSDDNLAISFKDGREYEQTSPVSKRAPTSMGSATVSYSTLFTFAMVVLRERIDVLVPADLVSRSSLLLLRGLDKYPRRSFLRSVDVSMSGLLWRQLLQLKAATHLP